MPDVKISGLPAAATPLAGTEVLPIVQSNATVKVANNDLRPKQIQSNATSGVLQIVGPAAAATRVMTVPDANFTAARTDAAQTFTGVQTFSSAPNLDSLTASKGVFTDASKNLTSTGILTSDQGGTGNGFTKFTGPATSEKTFTLPNSSATLLYDGGPLGTPSSGALNNCTSTTQNANDNSTKVATTAYIDGRILATKYGTKVCANTTATDIVTATTTAGASGAANAFKVRINGTFQQSGDSAFGYATQYSEWLVNFANNNGVYAVTVTQIGTDINYSVNGSFLSVDYAVTATNSTSTLTIKVTPTNSGSSGFGDSSTVYWSVECLGTNGSNTVLTAQ